MLRWRKKKIYNPLFAIKRTIASKVALIIFKKCVDIPTMQIEGNKSACEQNMLEIIGKAHLMRLVWYPRAIHCVPP